MSIFSRLSDIINSNINHMLDKAENPEKMVKLMIQEMEDTLVEVKSQTAKVIADKKITQRRIDILAQDEDLWLQKAELAVSKNRDDLAKAALEEKNKKVELRTVLESDLHEINLTLDKYKEDIKTLENKLTDAKQRQKTIIMRRQAANSQLRVRQQLRNIETNGAYKKFEEFERKIDNLESEVEAMGIKGNKSNLEDEFSKLENESKLDDELAKLKEKLGHKNQGEK